jgi:hypothetical protein
VTGRKKPYKKTVGRMVTSAKNDLGTLQKTLKSDYWHVLQGAAGWPPPKGERKLAALGLFTGDCGSITPFGVP